MVDALVIASQSPRGFSMTPLERAIELTYPAFAILHQHGRFSGPPQKRVCEAFWAIYG
jgi:hypothetical protein